MNEIWRDIDDFEGLYQVSNLGRVRNLNSGKILKFFTQNNYCRVSLSKNNRTYKFLIHRLVAQAFIPNIDNLPVVNHKDENPLNNSVENLEWCTQKYNVNYSQAKAVNQYTMSGKFVKKWFSISAIASSMGNYDIKSTIVKCCKGKKKSAYGFIWRYA